ncbi:hypothetical protein ABQF91_12240 [Mycobacterium syngnathidarum]
MTMSDHGHRHAGLLRFTNLQTREWDWRAGAWRWPPGAGALDRGTVEALTVDGQSGDQTQQRHGRNKYRPRFRFGAPRKAGPRRRPGEHRGPIPEMIDISKRPLKPSPGR